jgi:signal transduction histidine kinase
MLAAFYWRRVEHLKQARVAQEAFSRKLLESQESERQRIAAELHDGLGQSLLIIKNRAWIASSGIEDREAAAEQLKEITDSASRAIDEVREIAFNLRPYQLNRFGLTRTLQAIFTRFSDPTRTVFSAEIDPIDGLFSKQDEISIYRIVQEGINNIVKHAQASEAKLIVKKLDSGVEFVITDNGQGFSPAVVASSDGSRAGFGLTGMAERVRMLGGVYSIESAPGQGATITVNLRIPGEEREG